MTDNPNPKQHADPPGSDHTPAAPLTRRWALIAVAGVAAALGAVTASREFWLSKAETDDLWQQSFPTPNGGTIQLASLKGKPLLINFWATWCPPCVAEMPLIDRFYRQVTANKLQILGLAVDKSDAVRRFLQRTPVSYPIALAGLSGVDLSRKLGNSASALPFTVMLDANGHIAHRKLGQLSQADLTDWTS